MRQIDFSYSDKNLLVGLDKADDAIAYKLNNKTVLVQSLDFFTPIVDDPYTFGQIAAANALSDIYAMGAKPRLAMNIVAFPTCLDESVLTSILQGGAAKVRESGAILAGGHTLKDDEPKYGLSVTGMVKPEDLLTNSGARPGDRLILTKPLGTGIITTAIKAGITDEGSEDKVIAKMAELNNKALVPMRKVGVNACTDVTGFGLLGHCWEMAQGSNACIVLSLEDLPIFPGTIDYAERGLVPGGAFSNRNYLEENVQIAENIEDKIINILYDPQTSGGLLIAVPGDKANELLKELNSAGIANATVIGVVTEGDAAIRVK